MKHRKQSQNEIPADRIFIGVAGGSAAGKTTLCQNINRQMAFDRNFKVQTISLDSFYKSINKQQVDVTEYNFDHPLALDFDLAYEILQKLKNSSQPVPVPQYCFVTHARLPQPTYVSPANIILFEGLMAFHDQRIRNMLTYKIFINCDDDIRLCRRIKRDTKERGRTIVSVLMQYNKFVKNSFRDFIYPTIGYADLVIPGARNNRISVDFIVQHIKNVAKKKNIFKTAQDTKVVLFGENQYFDMNAKKNYKDSVDAVRQSFLVFPTSDEHRRQLDFFFNTLMSQAFTQDYFQQVFIYQFMKIIKSLLKQLFQLKSMQTEKMQLLSLYQLRQKCSSSFQSPSSSQKPIKILFIPIIFQKQQHLLTQLKPFLHPKQSLIIINLFCDMLYPNKIYQSDIEGLIFINLYLVANKKRLLDILSANNQNVKKNEDDHRYPRDWLLHNRELIEKGLEFISGQFKIQYKRVDEETMEELMEKDGKRVREEEKGKEEGKEEERDRKVGGLEWVDNRRGWKIQQIQVLQQEHPNLCGFYALHNIKQYHNKQRLMDRSVFIRNFMQFNHHIQKRSEGLKFLKKPLFDSLQRNQIPQLINNYDLFGDKSIAYIFLSENYVINDKKSLHDVQKSFQRLRSGSIKQLFLLMGIFSHYFVVHLNPLSSPKITYLDSMNTPITTFSSVSTSTSPPTPKQSNISTSFSLISHLYFSDIGLQTMLVRLRIDALLESYNLYKNKPQQQALQKWLKQEYPLPVLQNDVFSQLRTVSRMELGEKYYEKIKAWFEEPWVKEKVMGGVGVESAKHTINRLRID